MTPVAPSPHGPGPSGYRPPRVWGRELVFWLALLGATLTRRRLLPLARRRLGPDQPVRVSGLEGLPAAGSYILAVNHFKSQHSLDVVAAVLLATDQRRPDLSERLLIVAGRRTPRAWSPVARLLAPLRWLVQRGLGRWDSWRLVLPLGNRRPSPRALRHWRAQVAARPALVFPEGQARLAFGPLRPGAGRWLATLPAPTLPVAVWWQPDGWQVRLGPPIAWSQRRALHDRQLGLNIAALLPDPLIDYWRDDLQRWRAVHARRAAQERAAGEVAAAGIVYDLPVVAGGESGARLLSDL